MASGKEFEYDWVWELPATPEELWPLVSDTNRFNQDAGLPPVVDARTPDEVLTNARRKLQMTVKGLTLEWEELPFEWLRPYAFGVVRRYARGPLEEMRVRATMEPAPNRSTRLRYQVSARPRGLLGMVAAPLQIGLISRMVFGRTFRRYAADATRSPGTSMNSPVGRPRSKARLDRLVRRLKERPVDGAAVERLANHLLAADDLSLSRIRPYVLARHWGLADREVLTLCLEATRVGILDLSWDLICPKCTGARERTSTLEDVRSGAVHCDTCLIDFEVDLDQSVEISFLPSEAVRKVAWSPFCVAGPQVTPHVEVQQLLAPGESREISAVLTPGRHRARAWGVPGGPSFLVRDDGVERMAIRVGRDGWSPVTDATRSDARIELINDTSEEVLIDVERIVWGDEAATAAEVTACATFRELFVSEVLDVGQFIGVGNLTVLFTDLRGSTKLYRSIGDAPAFARVMKHFDVLSRVVAECDGAVVKTIGDAVMAVFRHPDDCLRAVRRAQSELDRGETPFVLKAGAHFGPCIAVNQNDRLDYFGSTANIAARLGGLSEGGDMIISEEMRQDDAVEEVLTEWGATALSFDADVRGIETPLKVWRLTF